MNDQLLPNDNNSESPSPFDDSRRFVTSQKSVMIIFASIIIYTVITSITIGFLPPGAGGWRLFSLHPFLMIMGVVGMMGVAIHTKKLGGYKNTKLHAILTSSGLIMTFGGLLVIYKNKEIAGKQHFTSAHSIFGIVTLCGLTLSMLSGMIFLHPDFGIDQRDDTKRLAHKWFGRSIILCAWITCFLGLEHLTSGMPNNIIAMALFAVPLMLLAPVTLLSKFEEHYL